MRSRLAAAAVAAALVVGLGACSSDPNSIAEQARSGNRKNYVSGDGTIEQVTADKRAAAVELKGTTLEGTPWSIGSDAKGKVVVVNVWGSWCPPCIEETPALQKAWEQVQAKNLEVAFIGIDKMESPQTGLAFQEANKVTYPSLAYEGGVPLLALQGKATATPTTLVLDRQGRIAARVSGPVSTATLTTLVNDVLAES